MADAFRGLTIRLGADARPLNSAIDSIKTSAAAAQKQMNTLDKALKLDPSNIALMQSKIELMGDKAIHSARAFTKVRTAMKQAEQTAGGLAAKTGITSEQFKKLANSTTEAFAKTQKIRDELYSVDAQLEHIYDAVRRVYASQNKLAVDSKEVTKHINAMRRAYGGTSKKAKELTAEMNRYLEVASSRGVHKLFNLQKGDAKGLIAILERLRESHRRLSDSQKVMNAVQGYRSARMEAQAYESAVKADVAATARLKTEMYSLGRGGGLGSAVEGIRRLEAASDQAVENARKMIAAYKATPKSIEAATAKIHAVAAAEETLRQKTAAIHRALEQIKAEPALKGKAYESKQAYTQAMKVEEEYTQLGTRIALATERAREFGKALKNMRALGVDKQSEEFQQMRAASKSAADEVARLRERLAALSGRHEVAALVTKFHELKAAEADATVQAAALHTQVSKLRALSNLGKGMREFGFGMYASLTPAVMMAGRYAIDAAKDVDSAYRDMRKTVNGTEEDFEHLKEAAVDFSRTHVTSADTMLEIEAMGGQLGIMVGDLEEFGHTVSNLDIATNMDSDTIAEDLGKMATVMGITVDQYDNFGDSLVRLGNNMPAMESDIMNSAMRFMGMGKVVGMSADQVLAWATAAVSTGQKAEAAGSSMIRFMGNMENAVNGSDEDLEKWASVAGMSCDEFRQAFQEDASSAMYAFVKGMGEMQESGESVNQLLKELKIGNVRDKQLLEGFANQMANAAKTGDILGESLEMASTAYKGMSYVAKDGSIEEAGDALREAEKKSEGFSGEFQKMCNNAKALAVELGEASVPVLKELGGTFQELTGFVHDLPDDVKELAVKFGILLAAIGPVSVGLGTFFQVFEKIRTGFVGIQGAFVGAAAKLNTLNVSTKAGMAANLGLQRALTGLSKTPVLIAITAIIAGVTAMGDAMRAQIEKQERFKKATEGIVDVSRRASLLGSAEQQALEDQSRAAGSAAKSVDELVSSTAELVDKQNERLASSEKDIGQLRTAQRIINKYANTDLSGNVSAQGELKAAVELVNEQCGTQYKVLDAVNGVLADEKGNIDGVTGAINEYIAKKQEQIKVDQLQQKIAEDSSQLDTAIATWTESTKALQEYEKAHKEANPDWSSLTDVTDTYRKLTEDVSAARAEVDALSEAYDRDTAALGATVTASQESYHSVENLAKAHSTLYGMLSGNEMDDFARGLQNAGLTVDEFNKVSQVEWGEAVQAWRNSGYDMGVVLDTLGLKTRSIAAQYKTEMESITGSTDAWKSAASTAKMGGTELANALSGAGISATEFANISSGAFNALYTAASGDFSKIRSELDLLNAAGMDINKIDLNVDDEGVLRAKDQVIELKKESATIGGREFKWTSSGWEEVKAQIDEAEEATDDAVEVDTEVTGQEDVENLADDISEAQSVAAEGVDINITAEENESVENFLSLIDELKSIGNIGVSTSISVDTSGIDGANASWETFKSAVGQGINGTVKIDSKDVDTAQGKVDALAKAIKELPDGQVSVTVSGGALGILREIRDSLNSLDGKTANTYVVTHKSTTGGSASGAIVPAHASGALIPRNAAGGINGIATHAMMTNIGWVGEAGAEAIFHMRNAGGAVVPLSNRRYVRPFARAVASEIPGGNSRTVNLTVNLDYSADSNAADLANGVASKLQSILRMGD